MEKASLTSKEILNSAEREVEKIKAERIAQAEKEAQEEIEKAVEEIRKNLKKKNKNFKKG